MQDKHRALLKERSHLEIERNKEALGAQKVKDVFIPLLRKEVKPLLSDKYEDIDTAVIKNGKVIVSTFNHLEDF
jgi:hypothetical protein